MEISLPSFLSFLALFIFKSSPLISSREIPNLTTDQQSLLSFKKTLNPNPNNSISINNWSTNTSICNWSGVSCGQRHQRVTALDVSGYGLRGALAPHLGNLTFLRSLDINSNNFSGPVPSELSKLRRLTYINMGANNLAGEIPPWFEALPNLQYIYMDNNTFSGKIPPSLFNVSSLLEISMRFNKLSGKLPNEICSNTPKLKALYLSGNEIEGEIPANIYKCREMVDLRLPYNKINGSIPSEIGSLSMLLVLGLSFNELEGSIPEQFGNLTSLQLLNLEANRLTGPIPKQLGNMTSLMSLVLSSNKLAEFRALILAYMPSGNLEKWLHEGYGLDLMQRLNIAIDVALALEYLHHNHTFVVVHCDIKPSNVLLDEDMVAHVCDFGISKLFDDGVAMLHTKTLATIGYATPEYGSEGKVSTKGDVYSYGILLLEIFTQKKPTDDMFNGEMDLKEWVNEALQEDAVTEVVAPALLSIEDRDFDSKEKCASSVFDLAMKCLAFSPEERINMVEAVNTLQKIKGKVTAEEGGNHIHTRR